jgi:murein DD-endopeptidase MepM/ murein hydrolase activator NlpD
MLAVLRRRTASRALVPALLAASAVVLPGSTNPVVAEPLPRFQVVPGTVLRPKPPVHVLPVAGYRLTGRFGDVSGLWSSVHTGLDFAAPSGTPIRSVGAGRVVSSGFDGRYGYKTVVRLTDGTEVWYCHQSSIRVEQEERLRAGQVIGAVGSTGNVTGPHLHLEVHPGAGAPVDPLTWLRHHGLRP